MTSASGYVLGIDPGETTGWCLYHASHRCVMASGMFPRDDWGGMLERVRYRPIQIVIERPKGYGPTRPQVVDCGYVAGRLAARCEAEFGAERVHEMLRLDVCKALTDAMHGALNVKNDATAWAALVALHGEGSDRKPRKRKGKVTDQGGALGGVRSHERAALAVAFAWVLRQETGA